MFLGVSIKTGDFGTLNQTFFGRAKKLSLCLRVSDHDVGATEVHCEDKRGGEHHLGGHVQYAPS